MRREYVAITATVEREFARNLALHGDRIQCRSGCTECCHHSFEITDLEASDIARAIRGMTPDMRETLLARAREYRTGARLPCPALQNDRCSIYEHRPLICRKFGMPIYNPERPDRIFACELNFRSGEEIRDPDLIRIQTGIHNEWRELNGEHYARGGYRHDRPISVAEVILNAHLWYSELDD